MMHYLHRAGFFLYHLSEAKDSLPFVFAFALLPRPQPRQRRGGFAPSTPFQLFFVRTKEKLQKKAAPAGHFGEDFPAAAELAASRLKQSSPTSPGNLSLITGLKGEKVHGNGLG